MKNEIRKVMRPIVMTLILLLSACSGVDQTNDISNTSRNLEGRLDINETPTYTQEVKADKKGFGIKIGRGKGNQNNRKTDNQGAKAKGTASSFNFKTKRVILNSGYEMPILGLGTYSLTDEEATDAVNHALAAGYRLIDTAYIYGNEAGVGEGIRKSGISREEVFVTSKLYMNQYANADQAIDEALEKLGLEYIDLMLLHHPGEHDVDAYKAMEKAVADGKLRSIGLSNFYKKELSEFITQVTIMPSVVQNEIHPYYQEKEVIAYVQNQGIVMEGWYPLGGRGYTQELLNNKTITKIARKHKKSSAQVILRWNLQQGVVAIPGSSNHEHIIENLDVFDFSLSKQEMTKIAALERNEKHDWY